MRRLALFGCLFFSFGLGTGAGTEKKTTQLQVASYFAPAAGERTAFEFHQNSWSLRFAEGGIDFANRAMDSLRLRFPGSDPRVVPVGEDRRRGVIHDYRGNDPSKWRRSQPTFGRLRYAHLYPGIDLVYRLEGSRLKSEFQVAPGSDPARISFEYEEATDWRIDDQGALAIASSSGGLRENAPETYQHIEGKRRPVESSYQLREGRVSFRLGEYDPKYPLIIDPDLEFFLFIGGSNGMEFGGGVGSDDAGNIFVAGTTFSSNFPTQGSGQQRQGQQDAFVMKLDGETRQMLYSVLIGGVGVASDTVTDLAVDPAGNAFITGHTFDFSFPTTDNAPQPDGAGGLDIFVAKFDPDGQLLLSTFLGGELSDFGGPIALDASGNVHLAGSTNSTSFPTTPDAFQDQFGGGSSDVVVAKLNNACDTFLFSSYLGGPGDDAPSDLDIALNGDAYLVGNTNSTGLGTPGAFQENLANSEGGEPDAFVAQIGTGAFPLATRGTPTPTVLALTYLGGSGFESGLGIALNTLSQVSLSGFTDSPDLPLEKAIQENLSGSGDAFVGVLTLDLSSLLFSTYLGGSGTESFPAIVALADGSFAAVGTSTSSDLVLRGDDQQGILAGALIRYLLEAPDEAPDESQGGLGVRLTFVALLTFETPPNPVDQNLGSTPFAISRAEAGPPEATGTSQSQQAVRLVGSTLVQPTQSRDAYLTEFVLEGLTDEPPPSPKTERIPLIGFARPGAFALEDTNGGLKTANHAEVFSAVAFTNLSDSPLTVRLFERGTSIRDATRLIAAKGQLAELRRELFNGLAPESAWVDLDLSTGQVSNFFQFGTLNQSQLDGGVAFSEPSTEFAFTRAYSGEAAFRGHSMSTVVSLYNPNPAPVTVELSLAPQSGDAPAAVEMTIPIRGVVEKSLAQIYRMDIAGGYVKGQVTQGDGIFAFQVVQPTQRSTVLGLSPQDAGSDSTLFSAQLASGPGLFTDVNLINLSQSTRQLTLTAVDESGANLVDPVPVTLAPGEQLSQDAGQLFSAPAQSPQTRAPAQFVGSLKVAADGPGVAGDVVFGDADDLEYAAALALQSQTFTKAVFSQVANVPGFFTGLAFFNPGTGPAELVVEVYATDGSLVGSETLNLPAGQRRSALVNELVPASDGQAGGYIVICSDVGLIAQMLFGATSASDGSIRLFSAVPPTVIQ